MNIYVIYTYTYTHEACANWKEWNPFMLRSFFFLPLPLVCEFTNVALCRGIEAGALSDPLRKWFAEARYCERCPNNLSLEFVFFSFFRKT